MGYILKSIIADKGLIQLDHYHILLREDIETSLTLNELLNNTQSFQKHIEVCYIHHYCIYYPEIYFFQYIVWL